MGNVSSGCKNVSMECFKCAKMGVKTETLTDLQHIEEVSMHTIWLTRLLCKSLRH